MLYLVHTLKQLEDKTMNVDFVIEANDESNIKLLMNSSKVMVLGIKNIDGWPNSQYFFARLESTNGTFLCCISSETIDQACEVCTIMELPVVEIQNKEKTIDKETSNRIIEKYKQEYNLRKEEKEKKEQEKKEQEKKGADDARQKKIVEIIGQTISEINTISEELKHKTEFTTELHTLNEYKELLTKMRMGSNTEKSTQALEKVFEVMEKIEIAKINKMKVQEEQITDYSVVSNVDIIGELEKLKRAKQTNEAGTKKNTSDIYYTLFGIIGLYQKFIAKDIVSKLSEIKNILNGIITYSNFSLICISTIIGLYAARQGHGELGISSEHLRNMITLGISGIVFSLISKLRKRNIILILIGIILAIVVIISIQRLLLVNLALF